ncbi:DUF3888 domain-containing protein [Clostridium estertheticum]|uniref:DUF3888 domain-containing protein n=1 Tax=Clostridium estertheticum TaxID=238834 RepID=UPI001C0C2BCF|nr:DUF3888 domain-containing protein [Clostridium estertheticum]MBU3202078.1 DUF3888 domain-containing protein [Clostridium estertheticum]WAG64814.1 DUF3888 domain-containing protein [Clostridium estertheticum]
MKKIFATILLTIIFGLSYKNVYAYNNNNNPTEQSAICLEQEELYKNSILSLTYPYVSKAIENYYGVPKQFDLFDAKILSIKKSSEKFEFDIVVQVITFTGAHNPPRGVETVTVRTSPIGNEVIYFNHKSE